VPAKISKELLKIIRLCRFDKLMTALRLLKMQFLDIPLRNWRYEKSILFKI